MTSGTTNIDIRKAEEVDIDGIKAIADAHKNEIGFVRRPTLEKSIESSELLVAVELIEQSIVGFVHYHHRKDGQTTLYNIAVIGPYRGQGIGTRLISELQHEARSSQSLHIMLKCPTDLAANGFYEKAGFTLVSTENGKHRPLNIWQREL